MYQKITILIFAIVGVISTSTTGEESYSLRQIAIGKENVVRTMNIQRHESERTISQPNTDYTRETSPSGETSGLDARTVNSIVRRTTAERLSRTFDVLDDGAICDGVSHPLSGKYNALKEAQVYYPESSSLSDEIDGHAIQRTVERARLAGGGTVLVPYGTCRTSRTIKILGSGITLAGQSMTGTKIQAESSLLTTVQIGDGSKLSADSSVAVVDNFIRDLTVTRISGTIPRGSYGIDWQYYNYGGEFNTNVANNYVLRNIGRTSNGDNSVHYSADRTFGYNASRSYWRVSNAADVFIANSEWGRNKVETVDTEACFELTGPAQQIRIMNSLCIPRGPTSNKADLILANGWNDVNGVVEFSSFYTENVRYCFNAQNNSGNGDFSDLKFIGGRFSCSGGTFNVPPDRRFFSLTLTGTVNTNGPTTLPKVFGGRVTGSFLKDLTVVGGGLSDDWSITGNTIIGALNIRGEYGNLSLSSNLVRGAPTFSDTAKGTKTFRGNQVGGAALPDITTLVAGSTITEAMLTAITTASTPARLLVGGSNGQTSANAWNTLNVPPASITRIQLTIIGRDVTSELNHVYYVYDGIDVVRVGTGRPIITAGTTPVTKTAGTTGTIPIITTDDMSQGISIVVSSPPNAAGRWVWTARASITRS